MAAPDKLVQQHLHCLSLCFTENTGLHAIMYQILLSTLQITSFKLFNLWKQMLWLSQLSNEEMGTQRVKQHAQSHIANT